MIARARAWLAHPRPDGAEDLGTFRVVWALFSLWMLASDPHHHITSSDLMTFDLWLLAPLPAPTPVVVATAEAVLAGTLVLVAAGVATRWSLAAALLLGVYVEGAATAVNPELATVLQVAWIPALLWLTDASSDAVAVDAVRRPHRALRPSASRERHAVATQSILVVLVALYVSSAVAKLVPASTWFDRPDQLARLLVDANLDTAATASPTVPGVALLLAAPWLDVGLRVAVVALELGALAALRRRWRPATLAVLVLFHAVNALLLGVSFTSVLVVFALFVPWTQLGRRLRGTIAPVGGVGRSGDPTGGPTAVAGGVLVVAVVTIATVVTATWHHGTATALSGGDLVTWRSVWWPAGVAALLVLIHQIRVGWTRRAAA